MGYRSSCLSLTIYISLYLLTLALKFREVSNIMCLILFRLQLSTFGLYFQQGEHYDFLCYTIALWYHFAHWVLRKETWFTRGSQCGVKVTGLNQSFLILTKLILANTKWKEKGLIWETFWTGTGTLHVLPDTNMCRKIFRDFKAKFLCWLGNG